MTDITKCTGEGCELKETCYRFTAPTGMWQSYFMNPPIKDGKCEYQWDTNTNEKLNNTAEKIAYWRKEEDALNRRMNIIGQNGNTGEHYEELDEG